MRTMSLGRGVLAVACAGLAGAVLLAGVADGKKKHSRGGGKATVVSSVQHEILADGAISVRVKGSGGRVVVTGMHGQTPAATLAARRGRPGKHSLDVPLSDTGRRARGGGEIAGLRASTGKAGKKKKGKNNAPPPITPLNRDLAACSVGSENP